MKRDVVNDLHNRIPMLRVNHIYENRVPNGVWLTFEVSPLPPHNQIQKVIADIENGIDIHIDANGALAHSKHCLNESHELPHDITRAIPSITNQKFRIAIWEGRNGFLNGQPVVVPLEPEISLNKYPDHPHLNAGVFSKEIILPETVCYTDNPEALGDTIVDRVEESVIQTCIWLFVHQVWLATRKFGEGVWIGDNVNIEDQTQFAFLRNSKNICHCGKGKHYQKCHLNQDFIRYRNAGNRYLLGRTPRPIPIDLLANENGTIDINKYNECCFRYRTVIAKSLSRLKMMLR